MNARSLCPPPGGWWRERELWLLAGLLLVILFGRLDVLTLRGEESRRARVAFEMARFGDFVTPREQGELFLSQPPLGAWLISASCSAFGNRGPFAVRFPSALAVLLTSLLVYGYSRRSLSAVGAVAAALAFSTTGELFLISQKAETEAIYILFLSSSLLVWHWGYVSSWPPLLTWASSGALVGLASLGKGGVQPVLYFGGTTFFYLLLNRDLRSLLRPALAAGPLAAAAVIGAWAAPYAALHGWGNLSSLWMGDTASRFGGWPARAFFLHLASYPAEVFGSTLPWSLLLLAYALPSFRRALGPYRPAVHFSSLAAGLAFFTCWLPPGGQTRYFAPLYPCLAVLMGVVVDIAARSADPALLRPWRGFAGALAAVTTACGVAALACAAAARGTSLAPWAAPWPVAAFYALSFAGLAVVIHRHRAGGAPAPCLAATLAVAVSMALLNLGVIQDTRVRLGDETPAAIARIKGLLPPGERLVSIGYAHHKFAYYYEDYLSARPCPSDAAASADLTWFCFSPWRVDPSRFPFRWRQVEVLSMARRPGGPGEPVIVGVRLPEGTHRPPAAALADRATVTRP